MKLDQLAKVMRSLVQGVDDFVGFGQEDEVIVILPKTDLGEAVQILYQIHDYYRDEVEKLEVISAIPQENSTIQPLLSKIWGDSYQFN
jgi:PleD family two-component response regulator